MQVIVEKHMLCTADHYGCFTVGGVYQAKKLQSSKGSFWIYNNRGGRMFLNGKRENGAAVLAHDKIVAEFEEVK